MSETEGAAPAGLLPALRGIAATLLAGGKTRLELLANEIEAGKLRVLRLLLFALAASFCLGIGIVLVVLLFAMLFWEHRLAALGIGALVFLTLSGILFAGLLRQSRSPEKVFSASVSELEHDIQQLKAMTGHEPRRR